MILLAPLVWPMATLIIALLFRRDLGQALGRVGRVKYRDLELTFREDLHQAEQLARAIPPADKPPVVLEVVDGQAKPMLGRLIVTPSSPDPSIERPGSPESPAVRNPRESIEAAWGVLARSLERVSSQRRRRTTMDPGLAKLVGLLRTLGHRATRLDQPPPSVEDARRYAQLAMGVVARVDAID